MNKEPDMSIIAGVGFYAGVTALNQLSDLLKNKTKNCDADFPWVSIVFDNNIQVDMRGNGIFNKDLGEKDLLLCYSLNAPYEQDKRAFNLFNPKWYPTDNKTYLVLCSNRSSKNKYFSKNMNFVAEYCDGSVQDIVDDLIQSLALSCKSSASLELLNALMVKLKELNKHNIILGCTELLIVQKELSLEFEVVNPVDAILRSIL